MCLGWERGGRWCLSLVRNRNFHRRQLILGDLQRAFVAGPRHLSASVLGPFGDTLSSLNSGLFVYRCQATVTRAEVGPYCEGDSLKYMFH